MSYDRDRQREVRNRLAAAKLQRANADQAKEEGTRELVSALREAPGVGISVSEAARLAGITRPGLYHILAKADEEEQTSTPAMPRQDSAGT